MARGDVARGGGHSAVRPRSDREGRTRTTGGLTINGAFVNYLGVPRRAGAPAWLVLVQEPEPGAPPDPAREDEEHHRLLERRDAARLDLGARRRARAERHDQGAAGGRMDAAVRRRTVAVPADASAEMIVRFISWITLRSCPRLTGETKERSTSGGARCRSQRVGIGRQRRPIGARDERRKHNAS